MSHVDAASLASGLSQQRPSTAYMPPKLPKLSIPLNLDGVAQAGGVDPLYQAIQKEEMVRAQEYVRAQKAESLAREAEIFQREQANRAEIRRRMSSTDDYPRVTSRRPEWEKSYKSAPEPKVSTGGPAPTPKTSGVSAATKMVDRPPPASPRSPINARELIADPPTSAPVALAEATSASAKAAEQLALHSGGIGIGAGVIDFGMRIASGQPIQQAVAGGIGSGIGTAALTVIGSAVAGPIGGFVGGAIGGFIGGRIADFIYEAAAPPSVDPENRPVELKSGPKNAPPFYGGQGIGVPYFVAYSVLQPRPGDFRGDDFYTATSGRPLYGPILGVRLAHTNNPNSADTQILCRGYAPIGNFGGEFLDDPTWLKVGDNPFVYARTAKLTVSSVYRQDGRPDTSGDLPVPPPARLSDNRSPNSVSHPGNQDFSIPSGIPGARKADAAIDNYAPGGTASHTNGTPRGDSPDWVPHGGLSGSPHPDNMPSLLLSPLPTFTPSTSRSTSPPSVQKQDQSYPDNKRSPDAAFTRGPEPIKLSFPSAAPVTTYLPGQPDAFKPAPSSSSSTAATNKVLDLDGLKKQLDHTVLGLAGLTLLVKGLQNNADVIQKNTTPDALRAAAAAGTCDTTQPGGCSRSMVEDVTKKNLNEANNNLFNRLSGLFNNLANLGELALLRPIYNNVAAIKTAIGDSKLIGGISGELQNFKTAFDGFVKWSQPGRILNMFTFIVALHNGFMLSQALPSTIKQLLTDWLHVLRPNFGKQPDGTEIDINAAIDSDIEFWISKLIGEQKVKKLEEDFKAVNRIYQASTNLLNNMQMLVFSVTMALEIVAQEVSSIGNALKKYKVVGEKAFAWMNPAPNFKNKWVGVVEAGTEKINGLIAGLFAIDTIAQGILQGRQAVDQMSKDKDELKKSLFEGYATVVEGKVPEHKASLDTAIKSKEDSKGAKPTEQDISSIQP